MAHIACSLRPWRSRSTQAPISRGSTEWQAAFLFLLTSSIAPLINLSYMRMVTMALPYTITMGVTGALLWSV